MEKIILKGSVSTDKKAKNEELQELLNTGTVNCRFAPTGRQEGTISWHILIFAMGRIHMNVLNYDNETDYKSDIELLKNIATDQLNK